MEIWKRRFVNLVCELKKGKEWVYGFDDMQHLVAKEYIDPVTKISESKGTDFGSELIDFIDSEDDELIKNALKRDFMY